MSRAPLSDSVSAQIFTEARTHSAWLDKPVDASVLKALYDLCQWGPTSANTSPMRIVFVTTPAAREKLKPCLDAGNVAKTMSAPVTAIIASDMKFYDHLPKLFPHADARSWFVGNDSLIRDTAFRNSSLQGAYLMIAARILGLDCGAMSGFNVAAVKEAFFADSPDVEPNFLCNIGYGDDSKLFPRLPRLSFDEVCRVV